MVCFVPARAMKMRISSPLRDLFFMPPVLRVKLFAYALALLPSNPNEGV